MPNTGLKTLFSVVISQGSCFSEAAWDEEPLPVAFVRRASAAAKTTSGIQSLASICSNMQALSTDARPEVRNTGVKTLFSVVISQGSRFSEAAWDEALWDILFPLLQSVHQMAATSSKAEVRCAALCVIVRRPPHLLQTLQR